jgi:hypothetical protein
MQRNHNPSLVLRHISRIYDLYSRPPSGLFVRPLGRCSRSSGGPNLKLVWMEEADRFEQAVRVGEGEVEVEVGL